MAVLKVSLVVCLEPGEGTIRQGVEKASEVLAVFWVTNGMVVSNICR